MGADPSQLAPASQIDSLYVDNSHGSFHAPQIDGSEPLILLLFVEKKLALIAATGLERQIVNSMTRISCVHADLCGRSLWNGGPFVGSWE